MKTFASFSFGCRVNQAEKDQIDKKLLSLGWSYNPTNPDVYIINSCAVTQKAEREVRQKIYQVQKKFPLAKIIVTGCAATRWKNYDDYLVTSAKVGILDKNLIFIPNSDKNNISEIVGAGSSRPIQSVGINQRLDKHLLAPSKYLHSGRLLIKIQDGCNRFCSYCIVPYLRGKPKSRKIDDIIEELNQSCRGVLQYAPKQIHEVIFTAINTALFGKDTGESLIDLIDRTLKETNIGKISFGSIHPWSITDEFLNYYQKLVKGRIPPVREGFSLPKNRLVPFFHIPIQSGSDKILKLMNRGYTAKEMMDKLNRLHRINPEALLATDIIVGFPGEGEKEFDETLDFLKNSPVKKIHVFRFSQRAGTKAADTAVHRTETDQENIKRRAKKIFSLRF